MPAVIVKQNNLFITTHCIHMGINGPLHRIIEILVVIFMILASASSSDQPTLDCFTANQTCYAQSNGFCRNFMIIFYEYCGRSVEYCEEVRKAMYCRSHLLTMRRTTVFKECLCPDSLAQYHQCDIIWRMVYQHPCEKADKIPNNRLANNREKTNNEPKSDLFGQPLRPLVPSVDRGINCIDVENKCQQGTQCYEYIQQFNAACSDAGCRYNSDHCLSMYEKVRAYNVFNCGCPESTYYMKRCKDFRKQFLMNKCLTLLNTQATQGNGNSARNQERSKANTEKGSAVPDRPTNEVQRQPGPESYEEFGLNCHNVFLQCLRIPICLRRLLALTDKCQPTVGIPMDVDCQPGSPCMEKLGNFYSQRGSIVRKALSCQCAKGDSLCMNARRLFQPVCVYEHSKTTCLAVLETCLRNSTCAAKYRNYKMRCRPKQSCSSADRAECIDGIAALMGTNMIQRCSCLSSAFDKNQERDCEEIRDLLEKPFCLRNQFEIQWRSSYTPFSRNYYINESSVCKLRHNFPKVYKDPYARIDRNNSCSQVCDCSVLSMTPRCYPIEGSCTTTHKNNEKCAIWLLGREPQKNRRRDCVCIPGLQQAMCLAPSEARRETRGPGLFVSLLYSDREKTKLETTLHQIFDISTIGRILDNLLSALVSRGWRPKCTLEFVRNHNDVATFRFVDMDSQYCRTQQRLLKLLVRANSPLLRHHPFLSIIRKVLLTSVTERPDRYLPVTNNDPWKVHRNSYMFTTAHPGSSGTVRTAQALWVWLGGLLLSFVLRYGRATLSVLN